MTHCRLLCLLHFPVDGLFVSMVMLLKVSEVCPVPWVNKFESLSVDMTVT